MSVVKIKIPGIVSIKKPARYSICLHSLLCYIGPTICVQKQAMYMWNGQLHILLVVCHMSAIEIMFLSINWTLLNVDRYLYTFCSFKMSEEIILEWAIFLGFYIFLLVLFFLNIYFISSFLILYIVLRFIQSKNKKLLTACKKQGGPCDRVR